MKFRKRNDLTINGVRHGYDPTDAMLLRRETHTPKTQIFSTEELEGEPEERDYFCAMCKGPLSYQRKLEVWKCDECQEFYDTKIQDVPIKNINRFKAIPHFELQHYPTYDQDDLDIPFVECIDLNTMIDDSLETRTYEDKRVQHINLHNVTFTDAILKGALTARKKEDDDNNGIT